MEESRTRLWQAGGLLFAVVCVSGLGGCATTGRTTAEHAKARKERVDQYMAQVETCAGRRNADVYWVRPPDPEAVEANGREAHCR